MIKPSHYNLSANTIYRITPDYRIVGYNTAYCRFGEANGNRDISSIWGIGSSTLECASEALRPSIKAVYDQAFAGTTVGYEYECHSAELFRRYLMRAMPESDGTLIVEHALIYQAGHQNTRSVDQATIITEYTQPNGMIVKCASCQKVLSAREPGRWDLVRELLTQFRENISHGLCQVCTERLYPGLWRSS